MRKLLLALSLFALSAASHAEPVLVKYGSINDGRAMSAARQAFAASFKPSPAEPGSLIYRIKQQFGELPIIEVSPVKDTPLVMIRLLDGTLMYTTQTLDYLIADAEPYKLQVYVRPQGSATLTNLTAQIKPITLTSLTPTSYDPKRDQLRISINTPPDSFEAKFQAKFGNMSIIQTAPVTGTNLVLISLLDGALMYTTEQLDYLIADSVPNQPQVHTRKAGYDLTTNVSAGPQMQFNRAILASLTDYIEVKADEEKYVVYAFVDLDCLYCLQMKNDIKQYSKANITVRFVPYAVQGEFSEHAFAKILSYPAAQRFTKLKESSLYLFKHHDQPVNINDMGLGDASAEYMMSVQRNRAIGDLLGIVEAPGIVYPSGKVFSGKIEPSKIVEQLKLTGERG